MALQIAEDACGLVCVGAIGTAFVMASFVAQQCAKKTHPKKPEVLIKPTSEQSALNLQQQKCPPAPEVLPVIPAAAHPIVPEKNKDEVDVEMPNPPEARKLPDGKINTSKKSSRKKVEERKDENTAKELEASKKIKAPPSAKAVGSIKKSKKCGKSSKPCPAGDPEPDAPESQRTQLSVSERVHHDDDTIKHIESLKEDKHKSE